MPRVDGHLYLVLNHTDAAATHGQSVACSGAVLTADTGNDKLMSEGGTKGTTPYTVTVDALATEAAVFWESTAINRTLWNSGTWYVYLTINSAHADLTFEEGYICRVNAAGVSQETVASITGVSFPIPTGNVRVRFVQASDVTALSTDRVYMVFVLANANAAPQDLELVPDLGVRTPMRYETRIGDTPDATMQALIDFEVGASDLLVSQTVAIDAPTAETAWDTDSQVDVRGGRLLGG